MTALTAQQVELLQAAERGALTTSASSRFYINNVEVETGLRWLASDMLADGWLYLPTLTAPRKYRPVLPTAKAQLLLDIPT